jgi:hypothetical protein
VLGLVEVEAEGDCELDGESDEEALELGEREDEGEIEALGEREELGDRLREVEDEGLREVEGESEVLGEREELGEKEARVRPGASPNQPTPGRGPACPCS